MEGFVAGRFVYFNITHGKVYELKRADISVTQCIPPCLVNRYLNKWRCMLLFLLIFALIYGGFLKWGIPKGMGFKTKWSNFG